MSENAAAAEQEMDAVTRHCLQKKLTTTKSLDSRGSLYAKRRLSALMEERAPLLLHGESKSYRGISSRDERNLTEEGAWPEELELPDDTHRLSIILYIIAAALILFCSGGLLLGWGPLYSVLIRENQYHEVCSADVVGVCPEQQQYLQYVYVTGFNGLSAGNVVFGLLLDSVGPRRSALLGLVATFFGNALMAWTDSSSLRGLSFPLGYALVGAGGMGVYLSSFQFSNLFKRRGLTISGMSSLFNASGYIYMLLNIPGITREAFFSSYTVIYFTAFVLVLVFYPPTAFASGDTPRLFPPCGQQMVPKPRRLSRMSFDVMPRSSRIELLPTLENQLRRPQFWMFVVVFSWTVLIDGFFAGALPSIMAQKAREDQAELYSFYNDYLFPLVGNATFLISPFVGMMVDAYGFCIPFMILNVLTQLMLLATFLPSLELQVIAIVLFNLQQAFVYTLQFSYIAIEFPYELYGMMEAITTSFAFSIGCLSYLFSYVTQEKFHGDYRKTFLVQLLPTCAFFLFPIFLYLSERKKRYTRTEGDPDDRPQRTLLRQSSRSR